ncbi:MAG: hypothetical protein HY706_22570 [Candidatus Hydrogenedentes bacterium]|nr:hypothetical protein [Candidatus Hydrogenedentota bacterium]
MTNAQLVLRHMLDAAIIQAGQTGRFDLVAGLEDILMDLEFCRVSPHIDNEWVALLRAHFIANASPRRRAEGFLSATRNH